MPTVSIDDPHAIAALAVSAIRTEALLTPKPGLVDRSGQGSHPDMSLTMLLRSADSLLDTFVDLARAGTEDAVGQRLRDRVGMIGRVGEARMLAATGGVNTHRGALWTVGLLVTAAGAVGAAGAASSETAVLSTAGAVASIPDSVARPSRSSHGQTVNRTYGVSGAVGEAAAGFPHIRQVALPELRAGLAAGASTDRARLRTLIALISTVDDTCILHRGGSGGLRWMQASAHRVLHARRFDRALSRFVTRAEHRRLSPGGSADLLSGSIFLDSLSLPTTVALQECAHADV